MKLTIQLDDDVYEQALEVHKNKAGVEKAILKGFGLIKDIDPNERFFIITGEVRKGIEKVVQTTVADGPSVLRHLINMSKVKIGSVDRSFTADELIRLNTQAAFHGWTPERFLELTSDEAIRYVMDRI